MTSDVTPLGVTRHPSSLSLIPHPSNQPLPPPVHAPPRETLPDAEGIRDLRVRQVLEHPEHQRLAVVRRHLRDGGGRARRVPSREDGGLRTGGGVGEVERRLERLVSPEGAAALPPPVPRDPVEPRLQV